MSKFLILAGVLLILAGILSYFLERWRLPGDILIQRNNLTIYIPIATSILLSIVLTIVLNLFLRK
ncbi:MAG: DUF2905 domain-containing protein [Aquificaceae bacterium]